MEVDMRKFGTGDGKILGEQEKAEPMTEEELDELLDEQRDVITDPDDSDRAD